MTGEPWYAAGLPDADYQAGEPQSPRTPADRAGRFAALSLLLIAMLIWLFTALLFARHGFYHQQGPMMPQSHFFDQTGPFQGPWPGNP